MTAATIATAGALAVIIAIRAVNIKLESKRLGEMKRQADKKSNQWIR